MSVARNNRRRAPRRMALVRLGVQNVSGLTEQLVASCRDLSRHWHRIQAGVSALLSTLFDGSTPQRRRQNRYAFRPSVNGTPTGGLEPRLLMSNLPGTFFLNNPSARVAYRYNNPELLSPGAPHTNTNYPRGRGVSTQTAHGGQSVIVATPSGHFKIQLTQFIPPPGEGASATTQNPIQGQTPGAGVVQPIGTVRAYAMGGGKVGIIVDGSTTQTELDISPMPFPQQKGYAHSFAYGQSTQTHILNVGQITVNSGSISAILGYHTANLSGPLTVSGNAPVDRIAFNSLLPGATITTGGDLNTLDVLTGANLSGSGTGIHIGRDLNLVNVGNNLALSNGATLTVGRFLGTTPQPPKGTATGSNLLAQNQALVGTGTSNTIPSLTGYIQGNVSIASGSTFTVTSGIADSSATGSGGVLSTSVFLINGNVTGASNINIPGIIPSTTISTTANFVARNGFSA